jgi:hypothetical protein
MAAVDPARELGRWLLLAGLLAAALGAVLLFGARLPFRLGRLPGDIAIEGRRGSFHFPIVTCIVLSVVLTVVLRLIAWLRR